jgi:hypothetical protein
VSPLTTDPSNGVTGQLVTFNFGGVDGDTSAQPFLGLGHGTIAKGLALHISTTSGTLPVPRFLKPAGKPATVVIGGVNKDFTLSAAARRAVGMSTFSMTGRMKRCFQATFNLAINRSTAKRLRQFGFENKTMVYEKQSSPPSYYKTGSFILGAPVLGNIH